MTALPGEEAEQVAVVIPCFNEEASISKVVADFRRALPSARVLVVDNFSSDQTAARARQAGAEVLREPRQGKGFALLRGLMAARDADLFVMVDGDDTYPAEEVGRLIAATRSGAGMAIATRLESAEPGALPGGHGFGNALFVLLVRLLFGLRTRDLFSGYRVMTRQFLDVSPLLSQGFEVESELSLQALARGFRVAEVPVRYRARAQDSKSKLRTWSDGFRILMAILTFFRDYRPLTFFGLLALFFLVMSLGGGAVVVTGFLRTGLVQRLPLAVLSMGLFILSSLCLSCGVLLSSINRRAAELAAAIGWKRAQD
ncbi:MAG TPA: glycosyltransferase family 2 protein [Myxococcales bacterium]|nr:glycosyltransferase family 2 protein [Myxococcales bacterium]